MRTVEPPASKEESEKSSPPGQSWQGIGRILLFFLFLTALCYTIQLCISSGLRRITTSKFGSMNAWTSGHVGTEIIINGSSRALVHYDPRIIARETGLTAYNLGMNGIQIDVQAGILEAYLRKNKAPSVIIQNLETFSLEATKAGEIYDPGVYLPYLSNEALYHALHEIDPQVWKWRHIPLYGYAVPDMRFTWALGVLRWLGVQGSQDYFDGFNPRYEQWGQDFENFRKSVSRGVSYRIEPRGVASLERCLRLAQESHAKMILIFAPEYIEMQRLEKNREEIFENFRELAAKYGAEFWDYSDSPLSRDRGHFYNSQHLNAQGAELFSEDVARRLRRFLEERKATAGPAMTQASPGSE